MTGGQNFIFFKAAVAGSWFFTKFLFLFLSLQFPALFQWEEQIIPRKDNRKLMCSHHPRYLEAKNTHQI